MSSAPSHDSQGPPGGAKPRRYDTALGVVGIAPHELPSLPDTILTDPRAGYLDPRRWFGHPERPFELEIGSGKGTFIVEQARAMPLVNYLGIEWEGEFSAHAADRVRRAGLANVRMLHADAVEFLRWRCPDALIRVIHLYFSDPWPKPRHHKNRVIQDTFLAQAWRTLTPGGELRIVTDHDDYWTWMESHFARWTLAPCTDPTPHAFERLPFEPPASARSGELVGTNFERKYQREGRSFHAVTLRRPER